MAAAIYSRVVGVCRSVSRLSGVRKAKPAYLVLEAADSMRTRVATAVLRTVDVVKGGISLKDLAEALQVVDLNGVLQVLDLDRRFQAAAKGAGLHSEETSLLEALKDTWIAGARAELGALNKVSVQKSTISKAGIGVELAFDLNNPEAIAFLSSYTMNLIREISDETRRAIGDVVMEAFQYGGHPYEQARTIRNMIGLTQRQTQAVANFRRMLENEPLMALSRELRDHRFDSTVEQAGRMRIGLPKEKIDQMVQRYYERYLKYRAEMIARTETIRAAHFGQKETWRQAIAQKLLSPLSPREWIVTPDDRLCEFCRPIPKLNPEGVGMDEMFQTPMGPTDGPPLHPHCRCTTGLKVDWGT